MSQVYLPTDQRQRQGGWLFIGMLAIFFVSSLLLFGIYAATRMADKESNATIPVQFLWSTVCLLVISGLVHAATRTVRRSRRGRTSILLSISAIAAIVFMAIQYESMIDMLAGPALAGGTAKGMVGMIAVLAFLHALHVAGGIIALGIVSVRSWLGRYDHERHWPVDFAAHYWHFLDVVWICMLGSFLLTTGGFA